jgi:hypothetical protein
LTRKLMVSVRFSKPRQSHETRPNTSSTIPEHAKVKGEFKRTTVNLDDAGAAYQYMYL